jgi:hypothetical protein
VGGGGSVGGKGEEVKTQASLSPPTLPTLPTLPTPLLSQHRSRP